MLHNEIVSDTMTCSRWKMVSCFLFPLAAHANRCLNMELGKDCKLSIRLPLWDILCILHFILLSLHFSYKCFHFQVIMEYCSFCYNPKVHFLSNFSSCIFAFFSRSLKEPPALFFFFFKKAIFNPHSTQVSLINTWLSILLPCPTSEMNQKTARGGSEPTGCPIALILFLIISHIHLHITMPRSMFANFLLPFWLVGQKSWWSSLGILALSFLSGTIFSLSIVYIKKPKRWAAMHLVVVFNSSLLTGGFKMCYFFSVQVLPKFTASP